MPEDLAKLVQEAADADRRSKSDWIVLQLEAIFAKRAQRKADKGAQLGAWLEPTRSAPWISSAIPP